MDNNGKRMMVIWTMMTNWQWLCGK